MATSPVPFVSEEEYLRRDSEAVDEKFEYFAGAMYAMSGGTSRHSRIIINCSYLLEGSLRNAACQVFDSNLRIRIAAPPTPIRPATAYYIESLQAYVMIAQDEPRVSVHLRQPDGAWLLRDYTEAGGQFDIPPIGVTISMRELYHRIDFTEPESGEE
jgi:hypothetical protein